MTGVLNKDPNVWLGGARYPPPLLPSAPILFLKKFLLKMIKKLWSQNRKMFKTQIFVFILFHLVEEWNWSKKFDIARPYGRIKIESRIYRFSILTISNTSANPIKLFKVVIPRRNKVECLSLAAMKMTNTLAYCCPLHLNSFRQFWLRSNWKKFVQYRSTGKLMKSLTQAELEKNDTQHNNK
jgi:hypothetical protein